jgi:hypothetical protein
MSSISSGLRARCNSRWTQARLLRPRSQQPGLTPPVRSRPRPPLPPSHRRLENQCLRSWPLRQMRRSPTCRLPSSDKTKPKLVAENKSRPLEPLLLMAQVSAYPPAASYRELGAMC